MNPREAGALLMTMQAAWPGFAKDDVAVGLWMGYLERQAMTVAQDATRQLIESIGPRYAPGPTVAEWQETCREAAKRLLPRPKALGSGGKRLTREEFAQRVAETKRVVAEKRGPLVKPLVGVLDGAGSRPVQCAHPAWNTVDGQRVCASCGSISEKVDA